MIEEQGNPRCEPDLTTLPFVSHDTHDASPEKDRAQTSGESDQPKNHTIPLPLYFSGSDYERRILL